MFAWILIGVGLGIIGGVIAVKYNAAVAALGGAIVAVGSFIGADGLMQLADHGLTGDCKLLLDPQARVDCYDTALNRVLVAAAVGVSFFVAGGITYEVLSKSQPQPG